MGNLNTATSGAPKGPAIIADCIIDSHMHIQSGACAPLPLIWNQNFFTGAIEPQRDFLNLMAPLVLGSGGVLQQKPTEQIGGVVVKENQIAYGPPIPASIEKAYSAAKSLYTPMICQTMDMDYAQILGFPNAKTPGQGGLTIYQEESIEQRRPSLGLGAGSAPSTIKTRVFYYKRHHGLDPIEKCDKIDVSHEKPEKGWKFKNYFAQYSTTIEAVKQSPWALIPMFHYDPRRWRNATGTHEEETCWKYGSWDFPFSKIATNKSAGIWIGFKMYPPLGYKPLDPRLPLLNNFYARCMSEQIPILTHCSPGGLTTHDAKFYAQLDGVDFAKLPLQKNPNDTYDKSPELDYFFCNYVHPREWRKVLVKFPQLKLCLAHLGGSEWEKKNFDSEWIKEIIALCKEFPNVYTDMSCFNLEDKDVRSNVMSFFNLLDDPQYAHMQQKLLFGTDWYLTLLTEGKTKYKDYCEDFFNAINSVNAQSVRNTLWYRMTLINSVKFYGLDNLDILKNMNFALGAAFDNQSKTAKTVINDRYQRMIKLKEQIDKITL